jgi:rhodanese-related sulfurtransferase
MSKPRNDLSRSRIVSHRASIVATLLAAAGLAVSSTASAGADEQPDSHRATTRLAAEKQTTLGLYVTAKEAYEKWKAAPDKVTVLDVRTPEEFLFIGHADMAWSIPLAAQKYQWDAEKKQFPMQPLPDFVARVQKVAKPGDTLLVMCRSGGRSAMAVNLLAKAGFKNVYNITDGMEGDAVKDPDSVFNGQRLVNGWKNSGLPWTYRTDPARTVWPADFSRDAGDAPGRPTDAD